VIACHVNADSDYEIDCPTCSPAHGRSVLGYTRVDDVATLVCSRCGEALSGPARVVSREARNAVIGLQYLKPGDVVLDVGANNGIYAENYARAVGPTGAVLAIEPHPLAVEEARTWAARYPWLTVMQVALADEAGRRPLYCYQNDALRASLWAANVNHEAPGSQPVNVTTLDTVVASMPRVPRLIKLDTQGAEAAILAGAAETLAKPIVWVVEIWSLGLANAGSSAEAVIDTFKAHGYCPHAQNGNPQDWDTVTANAARKQGHSSIDVVFVPRFLPGNGTVGETA
jgi:FkbM family methyltransferase